MKIGVYAGTFNPWHKGHTDIVDKAILIFDKVIIAVGVNPEKEDTNHQVLLPESLEGLQNVQVKYFSGLLVDFVKKEKASAVIRGLRNGSDLQYEMCQQYWNEDLGLNVPVVYFICDRKLSHISSSMIRQLDKIHRKI